LQRDPVEFGDSCNVYEYVAGAPTALTDPTGQFIGGIVQGVTVAGLQGLGAIGDLGDALRGLYTCFGLYTTLQSYRVFQSFDHDWAMDWSAADDAYTMSAEFAAGRGSWFEPDGDDQGADGPAMADGSLEGVSRAKYTARRSAWGGLRRELWMQEGEYNRSFWKLQGLTEAELDDMKLHGNAAPGWVVHHRKPLMHNGRNGRGNLLIMPGEYHQKNYRTLHKKPYVDPNKPPGGLQPVPGRKPPKGKPLPPKWVPDLPHVPRTPRLPPIPRLR
jgi:hypothetical protein